MSQQLRIIWRVDKRIPLTVAYRQGIIFILNENQTCSKGLGNLWRLEIERTCSLQKGSGNLWRLEMERTCSLQKGLGNLWRLEIERTCSLQKG
ncbi:TPA: hypothetical protein ACGOY3_001907, partial [Streptococcus suis]